ncbi:energy transducer TonB [Prevotella melaninogenica]|uniref:energy transducer TonB n=1 Tax=Prevotella melaninogenica TaxID=28132 RepID=UPI0020131959|nr:energy transducer TonB [Prevotella melaninogenica]
MPQFDGNLAAAIGQNFSYTGLNPATTPVGRTYASFIVDTDGSLKDIVFLTVNNIELNRSIAAALQLLRGWKPAMHNGKPVACRYNLPLTLHFQ